jgi:hypothetical protein
MSVQPRLLDHFGASPAFAHDLNVVNLSEGCYHLYKHRFLEFTEVTGDPWIFVI